MLISLALAQSSRWALPYAHSCARPAAVLPKPENAWLCKSRTVCTAAAPPLLILRKKWREYLGLKEVQVPHSQTKSTAGLVDSTILFSELAEIAWLWRVITTWAGPFLAEGHEGIRSQPNKLLQRKIKKQQSLTLSSSKSALLFLSEICLKWNWHKCRNSFWSEIQASYLNCITALKKHILVDVNIHLFKLLLCVSCKLQHSYLSWEKN